jgi:hypothetical protein
MVLGQVMFDQPISARSPLIIQHLRVDIGNLNDFESGYVLLPECGDFTEFLVELPRLNLGPEAAIVSWGRQSWLFEA